MKREQVKAMFPNASESTIKVNLDRGPSGTDTESSVCNGPLAKTKAKDRNTGKRSVRITSYRVRKCDVDGLCGKWHLDALRIAGLIHDDTEDDITYQISQKKVAHKAQEKTLIEIT
jgi:hypothetical protein